MSTATTSTYPDSSTLTNFKAWAQWISSQLAAFGWVQTADTGQVDWSTIGSVPSSGSWVYEIWKSGDSLSSAYPIYIKIEYGQQSSSAPSLFVTVSTGGTDGAGNLTGGTTTVRANVNPYASGDETTTLLPCYASGDSGSFRLILWTGGGATYPLYYDPCVLVISRSNDASGNRTGDYVSMWWANGSSFTPQSQSVNNSGVGGATVQETAHWLGALPQTSGAESFDGNVCVSPVFPSIGSLGNPTPDLMVGKTANFSDNTSVSCVLYGVTHTYIFVGNLNASPLMVPGPGNGALVRYE
jgi:hypothetical protein